MLPPEVIAENPANSDAVKPIAVVSINSMPEIFKPLMLRTAPLMPAMSVSCPVPPFSVVPAARTEFHRPSRR